MSIFTPIISWEASVSNSTTYTGAYNYTCKLTKVNPNDPGYGDLQIGYYIVDFVGHLYEITSINYDGDSESVIIHDILERNEEEGPYGLREAYVYSSLRDAALLTQAKLNRLDESAEDFVRSLGVNPKVIDAVQFVPGYVPDEETEGLVWWNEDELALNVATGSGPVLQMGQEQYLLIYNDSGEAINNMTVLRPYSAVFANNMIIPTVEKAKADNHDTVEGTIMVSTMLIPNGSIGLATRFGRVRGGNTLGFDPGGAVFISPDTAGLITPDRPIFPNYNISIGGVLKVHETEGEMFVSVTRTIFDTTLNFWNGTFREPFAFNITSDGNTITGTLTPSNGHPDMTMIFSDGFDTLITTPGATIELIKGPNDNPQENFVYIPQSTKVLTVSTSGWPVDEHIKISSVVLRDATNTANHGALKVRNWNDELQSTHTNQGHLTHITERLRQENAKWDTGVEGLITIDSPTNSNVYFSMTSGTVYQLHKQTLGAMSMPTNDIHIVNDFIAPYSRTTNINTVTTDSTGSSLANYSFSIVFWGVANSSGEANHIMLNVPSGTYAKNSPDNAVEDPFNYSNYNIPKIFQGTGFLIGRGTFVLDAGGTGWSLYEYEDLRGRVPNTTAGGGSSGSGVTSYAALIDTPNSMLGFENKLVGVNVTGTAHEYISDIKVDSIVEHTLDAGVTAESVLLKDGRAFNSTDAAPTTDIELTNKKYVDDNSGGYWTQTGLDIYYNTGNVGIGGYSSTIDYLLTVINNDLAFNVDGVIASFGTASNNRAIEFGNYNSFSYIQGWVGDRTSTSAILINPYGDGLLIRDTNTIISKDASNNLTFTDAITGTKTLAELVSGSPGYWTKTGLDIYYNTGNVGIGTTNPTSNISSTTPVLHLKGTNPELVLERSNTGDEGTGSIRITSGQNMAFAVDDNVVGTGTTRMTILGSNGKVGIGTTNPSALLEVGNLDATSTNQGNLYIKSDVNHKAIYIEENSGGESWGLGVNTVGDLAFYDSGSQLVTFQDGGNVGIGTTTPDAKLEILRTIGKSSIKSTTTDGYMMIDSNGQQLRLNNYVSDNIILANGGGNVGIGTTIPDAKLAIEDTDDVVYSTSQTYGVNSLSRVKNTSNVTNTAAYLDLAAGSTFSSVTRLASINVGGSTSTQTDFAILTRSNSTTLIERLRIDGQTGNVGIGDATPTYKLDVNGDGRFTSTILATNFILSSDIRLKENIVQANILELPEIKEFTFKADKTKRLRRGVIAQELEKIAPEMVHEDDKGFKQVDYTDFLLAKIASLENRLKQLEDK